MTLHLTVPDTPTDQHRMAVLDPLRSYNIAKAGEPRSAPVAVLLTDEAGNHVGGLWGKCAYDWMFVEYLAVPEAHRGSDYGTALMQRAEAIAREHGCVGIWLDTFSFQARGFYEKLGFELFGTLDAFPPGHQRFFLQKRLR
ncbi:GNAT family N-acetyltransferase [Sphingomonas sp. HT-1]|uniref:GNAT family N-acetyltransferase n=1 Tax=unclassified Sphingomonas TaxID=196159 RepID=UPI0003821F76|nr:MULTISPECIES: GNAT family N-acetyltransferase [unclassified Sphingomonas]KTF69806.1 GCN5 family acetyltransferase [Sphingomonas sp. WG]